MSSQPREAEEFIHSARMPGGERLGHLYWISRSAPLDKRVTAHLISSNVLLCSAASSSATAAVTYGGPSHTS